MIADDKLYSESGPSSSPPGMGLDEDLASFIFSLIDQNAELMLKIQEINGGKRPTDQILADVHKQAESIRPEAEALASARADSIIRESEAKAKLEAEKILEEAKQRADAIIEEKTEMAIRHGLMIIQKAQDQALSIINEVEKQSARITALRDSKGGSFGLRSRLTGNKVK
jgi:vacuolar-type H+-ATPase subunit H